MEFTAELATKIAGIAKNLLYERFGDDFVFDPIWVERKVDHDDDDYLELNIVFDGDQNKLDPGWTVSLGRDEAGPAENRRRRDSRSRFPRQERVAGNPRDATV